MRGDAEDPANLSIFVCHVSFPQRNLPNAMLQVSTNSNSAYHHQRHRQRQETREMATRGRRESSYVASWLLLAGIFLLLWRPGMASVGSAMEEAKETTESWANWVQDKVTEGLGLRHENARMAAEQIKDAAGNVADKISRVASDTAEYATMKAGEVKDAVMDNPDDSKLNTIPKTKGGSSDILEDTKLNAILTAQSDKAKAKGTKPSISEEKLMGILKAQSRISDEKFLAILLASPITEENLMAILKEEDGLSDSKSVKGDQLQETKINAMKAEMDKAKMKDGANKVAGNADKAYYEGAKEKVKETYEAAKEKASQATGDMGAEMKQKVAGEL